MSDTDLGALIIIPMLFGPLVIWIFFTFRKNAIKAVKDNIEKQNEAENFINNIKQNGLVNTPTTSVLMGKGERAILVETVSLKESQSNRVYAGMGTRIKGVYVGGGKSSSYQEIAEVDNGIITITNQRIVFVGSKENRNYLLKDIVSVNPLDDSLEISTKKRSKNSFFTVQNPLKWNQLIQGLSNGTVEIKS